MKKHVLTLAALAMTAAATAQPIIQSTQFDWLADPAFSYKYLTGQTPIAPGAAGANASWDFSSLSAGSTINYTTSACPGDADCGTFPAANEVVNISNFGKAFYNKTSAMMEQVGETGMQGQPTTFSNPMTWLQFPVTFNQTFTDAYAMTTPTGSRIGTVNSTIDAYGTLKTPAGTFPNVLRQKLVDNMVVNVSGQEMTMTMTQYYWMTPSMSHYVMSLIISEVTGLPVPVPATYTVVYTEQGSGPSAIASPDALSAAVTVYPNPAGEKLFIRAEGMRIVSVSVYNILGQELFSSKGEEKATLSLWHPGWAAGSYMLRINTDKGMVTKPVIIR